MNKHEKVDNGIQTYNIGNYSLEPSKLVRFTYAYFDFVCFHCSAVNGT